MIPGFFIGEQGAWNEWVQAKYERIFVLCYRCGKVGHKQHKCKTSEKSLHIQLGVLMGKICGSLEHLAFSSDTKPFYSSALFGLKRTEKNRTTRLNLLTEEPIHYSSDDSNNGDDKGDHDYHGKHGKRRKSPEPPTESDDSDDSEDGFTRKLGSLKQIKCAPAVSSSKFHAQCSSKFINQSNYTLSQQSSFFHKVSSCVEMAA